MSTECPTCGDTFSNLGHHLHYCEQPKISDFRDQLIGMILGDARIDQRNVRWIMTNEEFMKWFDSELQWLSTGVRVFRTPEEQKENVEKYGHVDSSCNFTTQYECGTVTLDIFEEWRPKFYGKEGKCFPRFFDINDEIIRYWYACDGTLNRGRVEIGANNFTESADYIEDQMYEAGYNATFQNNGKIVILTDDSKKFFNNTDPLPGFEYKWPDRKTSPTSL